MAFELNNVEKAKAKKFIEDKARPAAIKHQRKSSRNPDRHIVECYWNEGLPYGETISYTFSDSNGIGQAVYINYKAGTYSADENITDYDTW